MDNVKIKDLRVAFIPAFGENDIDQLSSIDDILSCEDTILYSLTDFFKMLNDEELPTEMYWTFLINIVNHTILNGKNINDIDQFKNVLIGYQVVNKDNEIHPEMDASFCVYSLSQARKMIGEEKDVWSLLHIFTNTIEDPTMMFEGNPIDC